MPTLSYDQVYKLARSVGLTETQAVLATAIAAAESGLDPSNLGDTTLAHYGSRGLWQIFTGAHDPKELGIGSGAWTLDLAKKLEDPLINAHAMWLISSHGTNWKPWSTYNHGSHLKFMANAKAAAARVENPQPAVNYVVTLGKNAKPGKMDSTTKDLQRALIATGFATFKNPNPLGFYGSGTEHAVRRYFDKYPQFQSSVNDTAIGPKGWAFLRNLALKETP